MKAVIKTNIGEAEIQLPCRRVQLAGALSYCGIEEKSPYETPANSISGFGCEVSLIPQNATDERILPTIKSESLDAVNGVYEQLGKISYKGLKEIEQKVSDGSLQFLGDLRTYQRESEDDHISKEYYCPLTCDVIQNNRYGDYDDDSYEEDGEFAARYRDLIRAKFREYTANDDCNMAEYFHGHNGVLSKLVSADWGFVYRQGSLYGQITCKLTDDLNGVEEKALKDWICGQNSDGIGEGFEQREIELGSRYRDGIMYVSLWHYGDDYFIDNEEEFESRLHQQHVLREMNL